LTKPIIGLTWLETKFLEEVFVTHRKPVRRHLDRVAHSIPSAAAALGIGEGTLRRAVDRNEIEIIQFGGLKRISHREIERVRAAFGLSAPVEMEAESPSEPAKKSA
jgi:excisionase family DNA binding protein